MSDLPCLKNVDYVFFSRSKRSSGITGHRGSLNPYRAIGIGCRNLSTMYRPLSSPGTTSRVRSPPVSAFSAAVAVAAYVGGEQNMRLEYFAR
jgi:hypothetical protein